MKFLKDPILSLLLRGLAIVFLITASVQFYKATITYPGLAQEIEGKIELARSKQEAESKLGRGVTRTPVVSFSVMYEEVLGHQRSAERAFNTALTFFAFGIGLWWGGSIVALLSQIVDNTTPSVRAAASNSRSF